MGHAAYFAIGGYASAMGVAWLQRVGSLAGAPLLVCGLLMGVVCAALAGLAVALPVLRLSGDYLAMATLGFSEIVSTLIKNSELLGGTRGLKDIPQLSSVTSIWIGCALVALALRRFYASPLGYAVRATRDDEIAARSVGIAVNKAKTIAFVIGAALAGLSGAFYAHTVQFISPDAASFGQSVEILLAVVIGGMFSLGGSFLGAMILVLLPEALRFAPTLIRENRQIVFAVIVIVLMLTKPAGLMSFFDNKWLLKARKKLPPSEGLPT